MSDRCFIETSDHDLYYRIAYAPPMGDVLQTCFCIQVGGDLCRAAGKTTLLVVRLQNGSYRYSLNDFRAISDCWRKWCAGLTVLMVDEQMTDTMIITTGMNKSNEVNMILFHTEEEAIRYARSMKHDTG